MNCIKTWAGYCSNKNSTKQAEKELRQAVAIDEAIKEKQLGGGMAYCLLEDVLEERKDIKEQSHWRQNVFDLWLVPKRSISINGLLKLENKISRIV